LTARPDLSTMAPMTARDAIDLAIEHARRLLGRIVELETKLYDVGVLHRAGQITGDEHDDRFEELSEAIDGMEKALIRASDALLFGLAEEHASALRRFIAARHEAAEDPDFSARLAHASDRALEALSVGLGVRGAAELRARREPVRASREAQWVISERERPARERQSLAGILRMLHELPHGSGLLPLAEETLRLVWREGRAPASRQAALGDAHRAVADLVAGRATVEEARARMAGALAAYDAALEASALEA
jgi:hypothetical protein